MEMTMKDYADRLSDYANKTYTNKDWNKIRREVKDEFAAIEDKQESLLVRYRDDQQIYDAGMNVINRYIDQLSRADNVWVDKKIWKVEEGEAKIKKMENEYKQEALKLFKEKKELFRKKWSDVVREHNYLGTGAYITSSSENEQQLNEVASAINLAEDQALRKIKFELNPKQENDNAVEDSSVKRDKNGKIIVEGNEIARQKPMFEHDKKTGLLTFTDRVNPLKIHSVLGPLFKNNKTIYQIDYTNCKNEKIKQKMMALTGGEAKCLISFNKEKGTYLIRNSKGETWENRALIREGVTLKRGELIQWEARETKKAQNEKLGNIDADENDKRSPENDPQLKKYVEQIPNGLRDKLSKLGNTEYRRFIIATENRLSKILKQGKAENYELESESVTKVSGGLMEVHFVNQYAEKDITVWDDSISETRDDAGRRILGDELFNLLDGNEDDYKEYVTSRVQEKWQEFDDLTLRENSLASHERTDLKEEEKLSMEKYQSISNGIRMLNKFIDEHRKTEGDSWLDNGDKYLASIVRKVRDLEYSIKESLNTVSATDIENEIITKAVSIAKDWDDYIHDTTTYKETFQRKFRDIFLGTKEQQIDAIRYLSRNESLMDRTESSFLADEIVTSETEVDESGNITVKGGLEVNDATINTYFQNINTCLLADLNYAESGKIIPNAQTQNIDELYNAASDSTGEGIVNVLISKQMIPEAWRNNSDVKKRARELAKNLNEQMKIANSFTIETIKEGEAKEKLELEMKSNKTEADLQRLQALNYLEHHPNEAAILHQQVLQKTKEEIKYGGVNNTVRRALASVFVEEGGGAKGANADIYNDIVGYGAFDLSDENAKIMGEILVEITITVAIAVATGGMGAAATAGLLRVCATGARAAKWVKTAERISKIVSLSKNGYRGLSASSKVAKFAVDAPGLLFEGTIFNNASKTIHAAFNGTSLDSLNFNPLTRENIETAAFLCALGIGNQIAGKGFKVLDKPGKYVRTKLHLNPSESLKSIGKTMNEVGAEMGGMLLATEGINLTFGHEVVDPDTGEVKTERGLSWPTNEEWATMIGMIIAFKAVKPGMWRNLADKLNDGTLIVCRTENRKNPVIRNTKTGMIVPIKDLPKNTDILNGGERTGERTGETGERTGERTEETGDRTRERTEETGDRTRERTEETGDRTRERTEETGDRAREETEDVKGNEGEEVITESNIVKIRRDLENRITELENAEAEMMPVSRQLERLRGKQTLTEKERKRMQLFEEKLESIKKIIAERPQEIQRLKDLIKKYEASHPQNQPENESDASYFDGKKSRFNISEATARGNSTIMDRIMESNNPNDLAFMRDTISIQYKNATGKDCPELTDQQLKTIIEAHKQLGELGNLTQGELLRKVRVLSETITDANFRRFLLESGFCGKGGKEGIDASFKKSLVDRDQFADTISKNRREKGGYPKGKIEIRKGVKLSVDKFFKNNPDLKNKYIEALKIEEKGARDEALSKLDVELAEKRILDTGRAIEFGAEKAAKADVSYDALNKVYNGRIERIVRDDGTIVLRLKQEVVPAPKQEVVPAPKGEVVPVPKGEVVPAQKGEIVKTEPGLLTVIESGNVPAVIGERLPATITLKGGEIVPTEKVMPPAVQKKLNTALAVIEKRGGLPAVIQKNPEIIPVLPSKGIVPPYWLVPLLLIPGLHWADGEKHPIIMQMPNDISDAFDKLEENPKITGVELPTDITGPFDTRGNMNAIQSEIDSKFDDLLRENHIEEPLKDNALILLRGVSSWTYKGNGNGEQYNENLSQKRVEEFKKYLMQKYPELTDNNFVLDSYYQPNNIDEAQRFQGVSMGVVDMQKYGGISTITTLIPSGQDGRVL